MITIADMEDPDEDGAAARERFEALKAKAAAVGLTLSRSSRGFVLVEKSSSRHSPDLDAIALLLKRRRA